MSYSVYNINRLPLSLRLGKHMETGARQIGFDCTVWLEDHPGMTVVAYHIRPGEPAESYYPVDAEMVGNVLVWHVNREDTAVVGTGTLEIIGTAAGVEDVSATCKTSIEARATSVSPEIPEGGSAWATRAVAQTAANAAAAQKAQTDAEAAADRYPVIGENGNWLLWDVDNGAYVDSGVSAGGLPADPLLEVYTQIMKLLNGLAAEKLDKAFGENYAGQLLAVGADGSVHPLQLGDGLEIVDGVLRVTYTPAPDEPEIVAFVQQDDGSVLMEGVTFVQQDDGSILWDGATFTMQDDGSVLIN